MKGAKTLSAELAKAKEDINIACSKNCRANQDVIRLQNALDKYQRIACSSDEKSKSSSEEIQKLKENVYRLIIEAIQKDTKLNELKASLSDYRTMKNVV